MGVFLSHPASLSHDTGAHPECAARIEALGAELSRRDWLGWERATSPEVDLDVLALVHPPAHIERIEAAAARAAQHDALLALDPDTFVSAGSYVAARHGAGGAVALVRRLLVDRDHPVGFSAHRPPGHHAPADRAMGFCLFNSVAVAARYATEVLGLARVAIVDWDVHHGNGTQDIFWSDPDVLFCSLHQMPLYPGTGSATEIGDGAGTGTTLNVPMRPGSGDGAYLEALDELVLPRVRAFAPELLLVSAGFDAHAEDPLAACAVTDAGFAAMAGRLGDLAGEFAVPLGLVLEGGYAVDALARSAAAVMAELTR